MEDDSQAVDRPVEVSLAWLRHRAGLASTAIIPIVGPQTPAHLADYLGALDLTLNDQHYRLHDEVSGVHLATPHEDVAAAISHGPDGDRSLIDTRGLVA